MSAISLDVGAGFPVNDVNRSPFPYVSLKETGYGSRRKATFVFNDCELAVVDNAGVGGQISNQLFAVPANVIQIDGVGVDLTIGRSSGTTTSLSDTWDGFIGVGTATGVANDLTGAEVDIFAKTATPQAVAGVSTIKKQQALTVAIALVDGTAGTVKGFLNVIVDDADQDGSVTPAKVKVNGTLTIHYTVLR